MKDGTRRKVLAHRYSYELVHGPTDLLVLHKNECHNPLCVNPDHLYAGSYSDNNADIAELDGWNRPDQRGVKNPNYKHGKYVKE